MAAAAIALGLAAVACFVALALAVFVYLQETKAIQHITFADGTTLHANAGGITVTATKEASPNHRVRFDSKGIKLDRLQFNSGQELQGSRDLTALQVVDDNTVVAKFSADGMQTSTTTEALERITFSNGQMIRAVAATGTSDAMLVVTGDMEFDNKIIAKEAVQLEDAATLEFSAAEVVLLQDAGKVHVAPSAAVTSPIATFSSATPSLACAAPLQVQTIQPVAGATAPIAVQTSVAIQDDCTVSGSCAVTGNVSSQATVSGAVVKTVDASGASWEFTTSDVTEPGKITPYCIMTVEGTPVYTMYPTTTQFVVQGMGSTNRVFQCWDMKIATNQSVSAQAGATVDGTLTVNGDHTVSGTLNTNLVYTTSMNAGNLASGNYWRLNGSDTSPRLELIIDNAVRYSSYASLTQWTFAGAGTGQTFDLHNLGCEVDGAVHARSSMLVTGETTMLDTVKAPLLQVGGDVNYLVLDGPSGGPAIEWYRNGSIAWRTQAQDTVMVWDALTSVNTVRVPTLHATSQVLAGNTEDTYLALSPAVSGGPALQYFVASNLQWGLSATGGNLEAARGSGVTGSVVAPKAEVLAMDVGSKADGNYFKMFSTADTPKMEHVMGGTTQYAQSGNATQWVLYSVGPRRTFSVWNLDIVSQYGYTAPSITITNFLDLAPSDAPALNPGRKWYGRDNLFHGYQGAANLKFDMVS